MRNKKVIGGLIDEIQTDIKTYPLHISNLMTIRSIKGQWKENSTNKMASQINSSHRLPINLRMQNLQEWNPRK